MIKKQKHACDKMKKGLHSESAIRKVASYALRYTPTWKQLSTVLSLGLLFYYLCDKQDSVK